MKHALTLLSTIILTVILSCSKKEKVSPEPSSSTSTASPAYLKLSEEGYLNLKERLKKDFEDTTNGFKVTETEFQNKALLVKASKEFSKKRNEEILSKYPDLQGFNSLLNVYNQGLITLDTNELKAISKLYPSYLRYVKELKCLLLTIPMQEAALLNPEGKLQIGSEVTTLKVEPIYRSSGSSKRVEGEEWSETGYGTDGFYAIAIQSSITSRVKQNPCYGVPLLSYEYTFFSSGVTGVHGYGPLPSQAILINTSASYYYTITGTTYNIAQLNGTTGSASATTSMVYTRPNNQGDCTNEFIVTLGSYTMTSSVSAVYANGGHYSFTY